uniref:Uncharacterized protein n=1 Tax=Candidatus Kentrum sp. TC TaxID=2126339 RepID=A0A450YT12_9GAMM|nr:MAG: hypothetical protein BECKTC1821E_GA0114239_103829 [Candidatus Kentron sp. TC]
MSRDSSPRTMQDKRRESITANPSVIKTMGNNNQEPKTMRNHDLFTDGVIGLGIEAGMIRLDLGSLSLTEKDKEGNSVLEHRQRVVMSIDAFLHTHRAMTGLLEHLEKSGAVVRREQPTSGNGATDGDMNVEDASPEAPVPARSPNFG